MHQEINERGELLTMQHTKEELEKGLAELQAKRLAASGLTEGRIVHYVAYNNRHLAALVIGFDADGHADLAVFTNMSNVNGVKNFGLQFHQDIPHSEVAQPGFWHWPERA